MKQLKLQAWVTSWALGILPNGSHCPAVCSFSQSGTLELPELPVQVSPEPPLSVVMKTALGAAKHWSLLFQDERRPCPVLDGSPGPVLTEALM